MKHEQNGFYMHDGEVDLPLYDEETLIHLACEHYNNEHAGGTQRERASAYSDPNFLDRIVVDYLLDEAVADGHSGHVKNGTKTHSKALDAISDMYLRLTDECFRRNAHLNRPDI